MTVDQAKQLGVGEPVRSMYADEDGVVSAVSDRSVEVTFRDPKGRVVAIHEYHFSDPGRLQALNTEASELGKGLRP